ncbi:11-beta-hydroxysteroid dehydrogenase type 2 [Gouania willdenowi]|uniref:11-beta-hydroxysteroid dehydrogenase type 2 n=1 Tax=Gouania willdenowi TaxID=441366 RepID=A0A8C5EFW0_GOUWI|nr:corticosteroid 11-beta-dehydrogenase isozyme 2 [Gouania willdenowi]
MMDKSAVSIWMYAGMLAMFVGGAMKWHLSGSLGLLPWLGASMLLERLWTLPAILLLLVIAATFFLTARIRSSPEALSACGKAVFITGCDSGFGKATAKHMDSLGFEVFATVLDLRGEGARELQRSCSSRLTLLRVDITQPQEVQQALLDTKAKLGPRGLWGLVNNAGICVNFGDAELSLMSTFRGCMEVNFFGTLSVTRSFLPLLRQSRGRIVTVSSPAGDQPFPCLAAYGSSKAALNLLTDTLRHELLPWGVHVSTVLPSSYKTGHCSNRTYWEQQHRDLLQNLPMDLLEDYGEDYVNETKDLFHRYSSQANPDLSPVVDAIVRALLEPQPRARYYAGPGVGLMYFIHSYCPFSISNRFLQRLFVSKAVMPRALRQCSNYDLNLSLHNNNNNEEKLK